MSDSASRLPARPSLEQLRKQAKELSASDGVPLAEAQFRLARRYGFDTWAALAHHVESLQPLSLAQLERLANDVLAAFTKSDAAAGERVGEYLGRIFSPQTVRARLREELGIFADVTQNPALTLDATRTFTARAHGFETWPALVEHMSPAGAQKAARQSELPYTIDWEKNRITPRHALNRNDWESIVAVMAEEQITGLDAGGQMTDDVLEKVAGLTHISYLGLGGSDRLTDDGLLHVANLASLEHLDFGGWRSRITDRGLDVLRHLPVLKEFHAWWTQRISDAGLSNLRLCERLESVDLLGTLTGDGALAALAGKSGLRTVKTGRLVTDEGLRHLREIPAFNSWLGEETPEYELMAYDGKPNHLLLDGPFTNKGLATLAGLEGLSGLSLFWHVTNLTSDGLAPIARIPNLSFLGCEGKLCDDRAMRHIATMPRLRMLMAQGTVASDDGFVSLSRSQTIQGIWGRDCPNLQGRGFAALAAMPALRGLGVSCKYVDDASLAALPRFPSLRQLMPMDVSDSGFRHVGRCEQLDNLVCMYCRETGDAATAHVAGLKLKKYYAGNTRITDASLEILARITTLENMEFWECARITDAGIANLARLPRLRAIGVSGSPKVSRSGMSAFAAGVRADYGT